MDHLRWILLAIGLAIIAVIYVAGRLRERRSARKLWEEDNPESGIVLETSERRSVPGDELADDEVRELGSRLSAASAEEPPSNPAEAPSHGQVARSRPTERPRSATPEAEKLVVIYVVAPTGQRFRGPEIFRAAEAAGLEHGEMGIFHYHAEAAGGNGSLFGMANMVNPGTFDPQAMAELETPGLALFLRLPGPPDGVAAFDAMLACAERLRTELNGELRDATRSVLSKQTAAHLREEVQEFCRKARVG